MTWRLSGLVVPWIHSSPQPAEQQFQYEPKPRMEHPRSFSLKGKVKPSTILLRPNTPSSSYLLVKGTSPGVTCPKIYELTPPHGTPLTPRPQELTPCANHHGTPALTDRFLDWFVIFLRDLIHLHQFMNSLTSPQMSRNAWHTYKLFSINPSSQM